MTASGVKRVRIHVPAKDGWPESVRGVGTRASCGCGFRGPSRKTYAEARKDLRAHRQETHG